MTEKKEISQKDFRKKIQIWTVIVPVITCLITSLVTVGAAMISSNAKVENKIPVSDQVEINRLATRTKLLSGMYFQTNDPIERERLNGELRVLANAETGIMKKYIPDFESRWPILPPPSPAPTTMPSPTPGTSPSPIATTSPSATPLTTPTPAPSASQTPEATSSPVSAPSSTPLTGISIRPSNLELAAFPVWVFLFLCLLLGMVVFFLIRRVARSVLKSRYEVASDIKGDL